MSTDTLQTILGIGKGIVIAVTDYMIHVTAMPDFSWTAPSFLLGIVYAVIEAVKGYYAKGVDKPASA